MQHLDASIVAKELNVDKVKCDMHQVDKSGTSAVGELTRRKGKVKLYDHFHCSYCAVLALKPRRCF